MSASTRLRRWAKHLFRALLGIVTLIVLLLAFALGRNYLRAETRGTVPLERLSRRGSELERAVSRALGDSLAVGRKPRNDGWYAARRTSADGDTIVFRVFRVFRAQDARPFSRFLLPDPHVSGGPRYIVPERRFVQMGIGVR